MNKYEDAILNRLHLRITKKKEQALKRMNLKRKLHLMRSTQDLIVQFKRRKKEINYVVSEDSTTARDGERGIANQATDDDFSKDIRDIPTNRSEAGDN
jgi:hypothetical protein